MTQDVKDYMLILDERLKAKTGWSRNEIKSEMDKAFVVWLEQRLQKESAELRGAG